MRWAGLLAVGWLVAGQACCLAGGKTSQHGPLGKTNFFTAGNGLGFAAVEDLTEYLTKVAAHAAGIGPPVLWVPFPRTAEISPDWVDEPVARSPRLATLGQARCVESDLDRLARRLADDPPASQSTPAPRDEGVIRLGSPAAPAADAPAAADRGHSLDIRSIYGSDCVIPAG